MSTDILMPALSPTMTEGKLARWLKKEGDAVAPGDVIAEIETDKAMMEVEAIDEGVIEKILVSEGSEGVAVNTPIARLNGGLPAQKSAQEKPVPEKTIAVKSSDAGVSETPPETAAVPAIDEDRFYAATEKKTIREALRKCVGIAASS